MVIKKWQIYTLNLNPVIGSEQSGTRPAIVVSSNSVNHLHQVTILPITSVKTVNPTIYPNEVYLPKEASHLSKDSIVLAHQIRTIDKRRLITFVGTLTDEKLTAQITEAIAYQLGE